MVYAITTGNSIDPRVRVAIRSVSSVSSVKSIFADSFFFDFVFADICSRVALNSYPSILGKIFHHAVLEEEPLSIFTNFNPDALWDFHRAIAHPAPDGIVINNELSFSMRYSRMITCPTKSKNNDRTLNPVKSLFFLQKDTSFLKVRNSNSKCSALASIVMTSKSTSVSPIRRRKSSMSDSSNPSSFCDSRDSDNRVMSLQRAALIAPAVPVRRRATEVPSRSFRSNVIRRGRDDTVALIGMYFSLVNPISST
mmetsp:Transcript_20627/g.31480  ORF Transcript_20627/g.31480 Transcript_20627/m.31480 type:complete len:253 (+) Transcript_20627:1153-1911(+)